MTTDIKVPTLGESVTEATVGQWYKKQGEPVIADEPVVELETDKVTLEVPAPATGTLESILVKDGETVAVGALLGLIGEATGVEAAPAAKAAANAGETTDAAKMSAAKMSKGEEALIDLILPNAGEPVKASDMAPSIAAQRLMAETGLAADTITGTGKRGQVLKGDVLAALEKVAGEPAPLAEPAPAPVLARPSAAPGDEAREERVRMTRLRQTIARRLKDAQNVAAMLTTFNEVDMSAVMALRSEYKALFETKHGVKLGFMGFFTKAVCHALKEIPTVNAEIDGRDIVYKNYCHIGVAVGTDKGLVVPVVRDADAMSIAEVELAIAALGAKARDGDLSLDEMRGGTFTISNGGVYGSLMSTPILNAPQSGILGMHKIEQRPVVVDGEIVVRPMMYLALTYDHRVVDGKDAVTFLVRVKEILEDPRRIVLDL